MRKKFLAPLFYLSLLSGGISMVATSCGKPAIVNKVTSIYIDGDIRTQYHYGETFVVPTVIAKYSNGRPGPGGGGPGGSSATLVVGSNMKKTTSSIGKAIGSYLVTAGTTVEFTYKNTSSYSGSVIIYSDAGTPNITSK